MGVLIAQVLEFFWIGQSVIGWIKVLELHSIILKADDFLVQGKPAFLNINSLNVCFPRFVCMASI